MNTPKLLHAFWHDPAGLPSEWERCLNLWRRLHPDWELVLWSPDQVPHLGALQRYWDEPETWSPKSNVWQHRTNLLRLVLLAKHGGVWIDTDLEPLRPIDPLLENYPGKLIAGFEQTQAFINNAFLAAPAGHHAVKTLVDAVPRSIETQPHRRSNHQSGAHFITPTIRDRPDVTVLAQNELYPYHWSQISEVELGDDMAARFPDAWMVHHWSNWRARATEGSP